MKFATISFVTAVLIALCCNYTQAQPPDLLRSNNPTTCGGSEGSIAFYGLTPGTSFQVSYTDDGVTKGPVTIASDASGQLVITGLNAGTYSHFIFNNGGTIDEIFTGIVLSNPIFVPAFNAIPPICQGDPAPVLPTTSLNGINGTWTPAVVNNQASGIYTFTPLPGTCGLPVNFAVTVNPRVVPVFPFGTSLVICESGTVPVLPNMSSNGIPGTWSPAVVDPANSGTYVFTPSISGCITGTTFTVTVNPIITPVFSFGTSMSVCTGQPVPVLPNTSLNGITGTWSPAVVSNATSGTYTFTPASDPCAPPATFTVTVNPVITPAFPFGTSLSVCEGQAVPALPNTSSNGITGTWNPAVVSNTASGTYTFTPASDPCAPPVNFTVTVKPVITPVFSIGSSLSICAGEAVPALPVTSLNGITGTWNPAVVSNTASGTYTFASSSDPCAPPVIFSVTVNPIVTPSFSFGTAQSVCINAVAPVLPAVSTNNITGSWSPAVVDNRQTATYTFTPDAGQCAKTVTFDYEVNPIPSITGASKDTTVYDGAIIPAYNFSLTPSMASLAWTNSNTSIGLPASGNGTVPAFGAANMSNIPAVATITARPYINGCPGATQSYKITVLPLDKDIFVPNVFSPNGDGKNDQLFVYGNYIATVELHIFNQWGQRITTLLGKKQGWDGRFKGTPQPVGVYVYVLKAELTDGRKINRKGSITLVR